MFARARTQHDGPSAALIAAANPPSAGETSDGHGKTADAKKLSERLEKLHECRKTRTKENTALLDIGTRSLAAECEDGAFQQRLIVMLAEKAFAAVTATAGIKAAHHPQVTAARRVLLDVKTDLLRIFGFHRAAEGKLLCALRGPAGESLLLWALLLESYALALWLVDLEPMLLNTSYELPAYRGESALHILAAKKELPLMRKLARSALFWRPSARAIGDDGGQHNLNDLCEESWVVLEHYLVEQGLLAAGTDAAWRARWMRLVWSTHVNALAVGSFFEPPASGGSCYYGGTPLSIAVVMGEPAMVRFLALEVGCTHLPAWDDAEAGAVLYPCVELPAANDMHKRRVMAKQLRHWDPHVCARIDLPDRFGNTAGHIAVQTHSDAHMFIYLSELYADGFGRDTFVVGEGGARVQDLKGPLTSRAEVVVAK